MIKSLKNISKEMSHINEAKNLFLSILSTDSRNQYDYTLNTDLKHSRILAEAEIEDISYFNIRNWSCQSDMGAPSQLSFE